MKFVPMISNRCIVSAEFLGFCDLPGETDLEAIKIAAESHKAEVAKLKEANAQQEKQQEKMAQELKEAQGANEASEQDVKAATAQIEN